MTDEINNPKHYQLFPDMQAIDVISASLGRDELIGYLKGNALKYRLRAGEKGPAEKCIAKANWYQAKLREVMGQPEMPDSFGQQNMLKTGTMFDKSWLPSTADLEEAFKAFSKVGAVMRGDLDHEPAAEIDDSSERMQAIGQNGNDGAAYLAGNIDRHPETPRHHCGACGLNHALHQCTGGQMEGKP